MSLNVKCILSIYLVLILFSSITFSDILWEDNFDDYHEGMPLECSKNWERFRLYWGEGAFTIMGNGNKYAFYLLGHPPFDGGDIYIASGGSSYADMEVSAQVMVCSYMMDGPAEGGVFTRVSGEEDIFSGYGAIYYEWYNHPPDYPSKYKIGIYYLIGSDLITLTEVESDERPFDGAIIRIKATGENPVLISAWFGDVNITYEDYIYLKENGFGGIYAYYYECAFSAVDVDNFVETGETSIIELTSIGTLRAIFR